MSCSHAGVNSSTESGRRTHLDINNLEEECLADLVLSQHDGTADAGVIPLARVGVGDVEARDGDGDDVVGGTRHGAAHDVLVGAFEDGGSHGSEAAEAGGLG